MAFVCKVWSHDETVKVSVVCDATVESVILTAMNDHGSAFGDFPSNTSVSLTLRDGTRVSDDRVLKAWCEKPFILTFTPPASEAGEPSAKKKKSKSASYESWKTSPVLPILIKHARYPGGIQEPFPLPQHIRSLISDMEDKNELLQSHMNVIINSVADCLLVALGREPLKSERDSTCLSLCKEFPILSGGHPTRPHCYLSYCLRKRFNNIKKAQNKAVNSPSFFEKGPQTSICRSSEPEPVVQTQFLCEEVVMLEDSSSVDRNLNKLKSMFQKDKVYTEAMGELAIRTRQEREGVLSDLHGSSRVSKTIEEFPYLKCGQFVILDMAGAVGEPLVREAPFSAFSATVEKRWQKAKKRIMERLELESSSGDMEVILALCQYFYEKDAVDIRNAIIRASSECAFSGRKDTAVVFGPGEYTNVRIHCEGELISMGRGTFGFHVLLLGAIAPYYCFALEYPRQTVLMLSVLSRLMLEAVPKPKGLKFSQMLDWTKFRM